MRSPRRSAQRIRWPACSIRAADFTPKKREQIFRQIKNNDWDAVILSHEQFGMIPQSPEIQQEILRGELDSVNRTLCCSRRKAKAYRNVC